MKIRWKIDLAMAGAFLIGLGLAGFGAYQILRTNAIEASREATLSIPVAGYDLAVHDAGRKQLAIYQYLQSPQRVGGLEVLGEPAKIKLTWRKSPERYVTGYRVYAAPERDRRDTTRFSRTVSV